MLGVAWRWGRARSGSTAGGMISAAASDRLSRQALLLLPHRQCLHIFKPKGFCIFTNIFPFHFYSVNMMNFFDFQKPTQCCISTVSLPVHDRCLLIFAKDFGTWAHGELFLLKCFVSQALEYQEDGNISKGVEKCCSLYFLKRFSYDWCYFLINVGIQKGNHLSLKFSCLRTLLISSISLKTLSVSPWVTGTRRVSKGTF